VPKRVTVIQVNGGCYNAWMFSWFGKTRATAALLCAVIALLGIGLAADSLVYAAQTPAGQQPASLISEAHAAVVAGRFADAIADYHAALRIAPRNVDAEIGLAQAYRGVRNFDAAKQTLEQARREHPKSAAPLEMLGDLDLELQTYDAAITHLTAALALAPANLDARNRLAVAYKAKGDAADVAEALAQIAKVLARDPQNAAGGAAAGEFDFRGARCGGGGAICRCDRGLPHGAAHCAAECGCGNWFGAGVSRSAQF